MRKRPVIIGVGLFATFATISPLGEHALAINETVVKTVETSPDPSPANGIAAEVAAASYRAGDGFRDILGLGGQSPEMVVIPAGRFRMGCLSNDAECHEDENPVREVVIPRSFALSVYEVTFEDYDPFTHPNKVDDMGWGRGRRPVINVSWGDAQDYVQWLSIETGVWGLPHRVVVPARNQKSLAATLAFLDLT